MQQIYFVINNGKLKKTKLEEIFFNYLLVYKLTITIFFSFYSFCISIYLLWLKEKEKEKKNSMSYKTAK